MKTWSVPDYSTENDEKSIEMLPAGFNITATKEEGKSRYYYRGQLDGKRYLANREMDSKFDFNNPYVIEIEEDASLATKGAKALITPVTVTIDGVVAIGGFQLTLAFAILLGVVSGAAFAN